MPLRHGARSIRGSLGTYAWVSLALTVALAVVLWLGPCGGPRPVRVTLDPAGPWTGATLDDGERRWELLPDRALTLPSGRYQVTLFDGAGSRRVTLTLADGGERSLGAELSGADVR